MPIKVDNKYILNNALTLSFCIRLGEISRYRYLYFGRQGKLARLNYKLCIE